MDYKMMDGLEGNWWIIR